MGAYIDFRLTDAELATEANEWLQSLPENKELEEYEYGQKVLFWDERDRQIELEKDLGVPDFHDVGEGQLKVSCLGVETRGQIISLWVSLFEKIHDHKQYDVELRSDSCGLNARYFTASELATMTRSGEALTGDSIEQIKSAIA